MKKCRSCGEDKEESCFSPKRDHCKQCRNSKFKTQRDEYLIQACDACGKQWRLSQGEARKEQRLCPSCYPKWRMVYMMAKTALHRAKAKKLAFDLDVSYLYALVKDDVCPKTGLKFEYEIKGKSFKERHPLSPSLDKIDPAKGYVKGNVQVVCWWYNLAKSTYTDEEVLELCKAVVKQSS